MNITEHPGPDRLELRLVGRLDATWASHVEDAIETAIRAGSHRIVLNFAEVDYISSLGLRVLLSHYKQLKAVNGSLSICEPCGPALTILKAAGLASVLVADLAVPAAPPAPPSAITRGAAVYQAYPQRVATPLTCRLVGDPAKLAAGGFTDADVTAQTFATGTFGIGLGAFGDSSADCHDRFGEFLAAGGCAMTLPTNDRQALPDYVVEQGTLVPRVHTLYGLIGAGDFPTMVRFDAKADGAGVVGLSALVDALLEVSTGAVAAFVVLAETAGLVGATLRRSPMTGPLSLELPDVRDWLSFTTERTAERSLSLIVGVAARAVPDAARAFLRPMKGDAVHAHVHAAQFPYRPVQQGELPFGRTVADLLTTATPATVMHLMPDTRPYEGVGDTDLVRGACWVGPLATLSAS